MNRKIIFLDCDGTLFDVPRGMEEVSKYTRYAVNELIKNGHLVFIASGRSKCFMPDHVKELNPSGFVTCNGGYACFKDKEIYSIKVKQESLDALIDYCNKHDGVFYLETQDFIYTKDTSVPLHKRFLVQWGDVKDAFTDSKQSKHYNCMMCAFKTEQDCLDFEKSFNGVFDYRRQVGFTSYDLFDFGIHKGFAVKKVLEYFNISKEDAYAFGDGLNDIEMFSEVKESYAVENGDDKVKALAKHICPDVLDDGFYQAMVWEGLIKAVD